MRLLVLWLMLAVALWPACACAEEENLQGQIDEIVSGLDFSGLEPLTVPGLGEDVSVEALVRSLASGQALSPEDSVLFVLGAFIDAQKLWETRLFIPNNP